MNYYFTEISSHTELIIYAEIKLFILKIISEGNRYLIAPKYIYIYIIYIIIQIKVSSN